ncbi:MAG: HEAT repeat domain-containing protein [Pseudomonadota bacterium]
MLRSSRTIASLIRSLVLGTATTTTLVLVAASVVGCKDESQPDYWVEKLDDQAWRARAVKQLEQFFEDSVTKNGDIKSEGVQTLIGKTVDPLTKTYVDAYESLDDKTRVSLIQLLQSYKDKRTEPAVKKAFDEFAKHPATAKDAQDIKWAALAVTDLKLTGVSDSLLAAFMKLRASSQLGGVAYRDVNEAMRTAPSKAWVGPLAKMLDAEMVAPKTSKDKDLIDPFRDQQFWQTASAEVLGRIGDPAAVQPLLKIMLDPAKGDVQSTALLALVKLGKPAADAAVQLLKGQDAALTAFSARRIKEVTGSDAKGKPYVATAALILGTIGRADSIQPMIDALNAETDDGNKAVIARELVKIPATDESKQAFKKAYESLPIDAEIPPAGSALESLTEAAGQFFDSSMVDWLLQRAAKTKGSEEDKKSLQLAITVTALKLAKADQMAHVKLAVDKYGTSLEKSSFTQVDNLLKACGDRVPCYITALEKHENQDQANQFVGIKAGYMIGILGNEQSRDEIVSGIASITNAALRFVSGEVIDHLSPKGSKEAAAKLQAVIDKNAKSPDREKSAGDSPLKTVVYRLEARAN